MKEIQPSSNLAGEIDRQKEACVKEVHTAYNAWGAAGLVLVEVCVTWANTIGVETFLRLARAGELPFDDKRAHKILTVGKRPDIMLAAKQGKLQDKYNIMYEAALIPKADFHHAIKNKIISKDWRTGDIRSFRDKQEGKIHRGSYSPTEAQSIAEETDNIVIDRGGKLHTGVDRQKAQDLQEKLDQAMELAAAVELLANMAVTPERLISDLSEFDYFPDKYLKRKVIDKAIDWLSELRRLRDGTE